MAIAHFYSPIIWTNEGHQSYCLCGNGDSGSYTSEIQTCHRDIELDQASHLTAVGADADVQARSADVARFLPTTAPAWEQQKARVAGLAWTNAPTPTSGLDLWKQARTAADPSPALLGQLAAALGDDTARAAVRYTLFTGARDDVAQLIAAGVADYQTPEGGPTAGPIGVINLAGRAIPGPEVTEAMALMYSVLAHVPRAAHAWALLAWMYWWKGHNDSAAACAAAARGINPADIFAQTLCTSLDSGLTPTRHL